VEVGVERRDGDAPAVDRQVGVVDPREDLVARNPRHHPIEEDAVDALVGRSQRRLAVDAVPTSNRSESYSP